MNDRLPSLQALRCFEAAARHMSFTRASEDLNVSQGVVSHHIKRLEQQLGVALFSRMTRKIVLTEEGRLLQPAVAEGFAGIAAAVVRIRSRVGEGTLTVNVGAMFGSHWLSPRLSRFWERHPGIALRIHTELAPLETHVFTQDVDIAIAYGDGRWSALASEHLLTIRLAPVCSPSLRNDPPTIDALEDLRNHTFIQQGRDPQAWQVWLRKAGVPGLTPRRIVTFDDANLAAQAAVDAQGILLGALELLDADLQTERLVVPFDCSITSPRAYHVVYPKDGLGPLGQRFRDWIIAEANSSR